MKNAKRKQLISINFEKEDVLREDSKQSFLLI